GRLVDLFGVALIAGILGLGRGVGLALIDLAADAAGEVTDARGALLRGEAADADARGLVAAAGDAVQILAAAADVGAGDARGLAAVGVDLALHAEAGRFEADADRAVVVVVAASERAGGELAAGAGGAREAARAEVL